MRHCPIVSRPCHHHIIRLAAATLLLSSPALATAQATVTLGFTRQRVSAGNRIEHLSGYSLEAAIRIAPRLALLIGGEQIGHGGDLTRDEFLVTTFRTGLQIRIVRSPLVDLSVSTGLGLHSLNLDREEDGPGATGFVLGQVILHPLPNLGLGIGGIAQTHAGFAQSRGAGAVGLMFGLQVRSDGW